MYRVFCFFKDCDPYIVDLGTWDFCTVDFRQLKNKLADLSCLDRDVDGVIYDRGVSYLFSLVKANQPYHAVFSFDHCAWMEVFKECEGDLNGIGKA